MKCRQHIYLKAHINLYEDVTPLGYEIMYQKIEKAISDVVNGPVLLQMTVNSHLGAEFQEDEE